MYAEVPITGAEDANDMALFVILALTLTAVLTCGVATVYRRRYL